MSGSHSHVFANPYGQVFRVECFAAAPGCVTVGPISLDFSWFPDTGWQVAICARCGLHLGWRYARNADGGFFFGLIPERLRRKTDNLV
ncbi:cereblon family protein [Desulfovibrio sp. TomC]|uniref:cereblon family protein n=1 Tax=Desulfovibrio sp. TomC TaxID=1562888 RepID=UPI00069F475C|nr:cereblon family protein [Desulfovibrio sp. TomC]